MINYTPSNQLTLSGFSHPFDQALSPENRWVKLAKIIPWDELHDGTIWQLETDLQGVYAWELIPNVPQPEKKNEET